MARPAASIEALENLLPEESCAKAFWIVCPVLAVDDDAPELVPNVLNTINDIFRVYY
jgi:hypothetical protein